MRVRARIILIAIALAMSLGAGPAEAGKRGPGALGVNFFGISHDGHWMEIFTLGVWSPPAIVLSKVRMFRIGGGGTLLHVHMNKKELPEVTFSLDDTVLTDHYGAPCGLFAPFLDLKIIEWQDPLIDEFAGYLSLYVKTWAMRGRFSPPIAEGCDGMTDDDKNPTYLEAGFNLTPLGSLISFRVFYRHMAIEAGSGESECMVRGCVGTTNLDTGEYNDCGSSSLNPTGIVYDYDLPAYDASGFGFMVSFQFSLYGPRGPVRGPAPAPAPEPAPEPAPDPASVPEEPVP